jgi:hypothetical protein
MRSYKRSNHGAMLALSAAASILGGACSEAASTQPSDSEEARVAITLVGDDGDIVLANVDYVVRDTQGNERRGSVNIASSTKVQFVVGSLLPASYTLTLSATSSDGATTCTGSSETFSVTAGVTAAVSMVLSCTQTQGRGSAAVTAATNVCPTVAPPSALPSEVLVGGSLVVDVGTVTDPDHGPAALTGQWNATPPRGLFADPTARSTSFECAEPGAVTLRYTASDGDTVCRSYGEVTVTCTAVSPSGTVWNAAQQFDLASNPATNNPWSYGYSDGLSGTFTLLTIQDNMYGSTPGWARTSSWGDWGYPRFYKNVADSPFDFETLHVPAGALIGLCGIQGSYAVLRWTAPTAGTFNIEAAFTPVVAWLQQNNSIGPDVSLVVQSQSLFHEDLMYGTTVTVARQVQLAAGDAVDVAMGPGSDGYFAAGETQIDLSISTVLQH